MLMEFEQSGNENVNPFVHPDSSNAMLSGTDRPLDQLRVKGSHKKEQLITKGDDDTFDELELEIKELLAEEEDLWNGSLHWSEESGEIDRTVSSDDAKKILYSRKVFIGGLPADVTDVVISKFFTQFGEVTIDWPHREFTRGNIPPNGYAFVLFKNARDVENLVSNCKSKGEKLSITLCDDGEPLKTVQIRPWNIMGQYCIRQSGSFNARYAAFIGGVPRIVTAFQLASLMYQTFGEVLAVSICVENGTRYPKGAARVIFSTREAYIKAIATHFLKIKVDDQEKDVEVKPYLMENIMCERCGMVPTNNLCAHLPCLLYLCDSCWHDHHALHHFLHHTPMIKTSFKNSFPSKNVRNNVQNCEQRQSKPVKSTTPLFHSVLAAKSSPLQSSSKSNRQPTNNGSAQRPSEVRAAAIRFSPEMLRYPPPSTTCFRESPISPYVIGTSHMN